MRGRGFGQGRRLELAESSSHDRSQITDWWIARLVDCGIARSLDDTVKILARGEIAKLVRKLGRSGRETICSILTTLSLLWKLLPLAARLYTPTIDPTGEKRKAKVAIRIYIPFCRATSPIPLASFPCSKTTVQLRFADAEVSTDSSLQLLIHGHSHS